MNNIMEMNSDGINIYITIFVKTKLAGKIFITLIVLFLFALVGFIILKTDNSIDSVLPILIFAVLIFTFPVKYLLWNFFGKEYLIINTKSISHSFDYGFYRTKLNTRKVDKLALNYETARIEDENEKGRLIFYNYNAENNLPEMVYKTNAMLDKDKTELIAQEIEKIFLNEFNEKFNYINFSEN